MRSRPKVQLLLDPPVAMPGDRLRVEALLESATETPVNYVAIRLRGITKAAVGAGKSRAEHEAVFFDREARSKGLVLTPGEYGVRAAFELPADAPPGYFGDDASVAYAITVHVSIPWWPSRRASFVLPVALAPGPAPEPHPKVFATSVHGPRGKSPFMEVALEATQLAIGDALHGSLSVQNVGGKRIRGVDLSFVETEVVTLPTADQREGRRFTLRILDRAPAEGEAIPFRIVVPEAATANFDARVLRVVTHLEARCDVAWGQDIVVRAPVVVAPRATASRERGWVAPVGNARRGAVWQAAAAKAGLITDAEAEQMHGRERDVTIAIGTAHRDGDYWLTGKLGWPSLGLDLDISDRRWSDALAVEVVKSGSELVDVRLCARAREHAQAQVVVSPDLLTEVLPFEEVRIDDTGAVFAVRGSASVTEQLQPFVERILRVARMFGEVMERVPPPALFSADRAAWEALAGRLRGRLELGRMWIHAAQVGTCAVEIGSVWERGGLLRGSQVRVAIDPPLEAVPAAPEDPSLSPAARAAWTELVTRTASLRIDPDAITVEIEGKLSDPQVAMPVVELAVSLRQALAGRAAAGPFR